MHAQKILFFCLVVTTSVVLLTACTSPQTPQATPLPSPTIPLSTQTPEPSATFTPSPTESAQATLSANATSNAAHYATSVVAMTSTALVKPTKTPSQPTKTLTPTPIISLTNREPSFEELQNFLRTSLKSMWREDKWAVETFYEDVNGDEVTELIVLHSPEIFVLSWTGVEYIKIFYLPKFRPNKWQHARRREAKPVRGGHVS